MSTPSPIPCLKISSMWEMLVFNAIIIGIIVGWAWFLGGTISWDALNHHFYLGREAIYGSRLQWDLFAVGDMSCQNPIGYAPLAIMMEAGWSGSAIFASLAFLAATSIPACWLLTWFFESGTTMQDLAFRVLTTLIAASGVLWWQMLTQTSNDAISTSFALWAFVLAVFCVKNPHAVNINAYLCFVSGVLLGFAIVMKLTQGIAFFAIVSTLMYVRVSFNCRMKWMIIFFMGVSMPIIFLSLKWNWEIWKVCGSPIYPLGVDFFKNIIIPKI